MVKKRILVFAGKAKEIPLFIASLTRVLGNVTLGELAGKGVTDGGNK